MIRPALLISSLFVLCSCASQQPAPSVSLAETSPTLEQADTSQLDANPVLADSATETEELDVDDSKKEYCTKEYRTGSRIPVMYCRTREQDEYNREHSKGWLDKVKRTPQQSLEVSG